MIPVYCACMLTISNLLTSMWQIVDEKILGLKKHKNTRSICSSSFISFEYNNYADFTMFSVLA